MQMVDQHGANRKLVGERLASDVISTLPTAAGMARAASEKAKNRIETWDASEVEGLAQLRFVTSVTAKMIANDPLTTMQNLMPVLQAELAQTSERIPRVRCAWFWVMTYFGSYMLGGPNTDERWQIYANAVCRWERAAAEMRL